jgi:hypothetical protein
MEAMADLIVCRALLRRRNAPRDPRAAFNLVVGPLLVPAAGPAPEPSPAATREPINRSGERFDAASR